METESLELEDGEVVDDDDEVSDAFETYKVLPRPHNVVPVPEQSGKIRYSDESDLTEATDSDSDSDDGPKFVKKPKIKIKRCKTSGRHSRSTHDKYKVWCKQVQEESLTEDLVSCGVTNSQYHDRSVESYNYKLSFGKDDRHRNNNTSDDDDDYDDEQEVEPRLTNKRTIEDRRKIKLRLGKRRNSFENNQKGSARIISDLSVTVESTEDEVAADIADKLSEKKDSLIKRIVEVLGKEKAIDFFQQTKKIEEEGGMLIMNGSRRRTAGGVYFFIVKNNDHITQPKIREIFYSERKETTDSRKMIEASHRRKKSQELMKLLENGSDKDLPALLNRAELSTRQIAEEARLRRGEGMDRITIDSERTVTNPPPSPVTDDPDHSEPTPNPVCSRHVQDYGDDFLELGGEVDMEVF